MQLRNRARLLLSVIASVDFRKGPQLRVRAEDKVDGRPCPLELATGATALLMLSGGGWLPLRAHVEQVHEEIVGQCRRPVREDAELGLLGVRVQGARAARPIPSSPEWSASPDMPAPRKRTALMKSPRQRDTKFVVRSRGLQVAFCWPWPGGACAAAGAIPAWRSG